MRNPESKRCSTWQLMSLRKQEQPCTAAFYLANNGLLPTSSAARKPSTAAMKIVFVVVELSVTLHLRLYAIMGCFYRMNALTVLSITRGSCICNIRPRVVCSVQSRFE